MVENRYEIKVNIKSNNFRTVPEVVANDHVVFDVRVWDGPSRFTLSPNYTYRLTSQKKSGTSVIREGVLSDDKIVFELGTSEMTEPGKVEGTVQIFDETEKRISSSKFDYMVKQDPSLQGSLPADNTSLVIANEALLTESIEKSETAIVDSSTAMTKAVTAETTANQVKSEFDLVVAEAGSNNPEVVQARGTYVNLNERLNATSDQLADIAINVKSFGAVADANYYDAVNKKYYSDAAMTIPATNNTPKFQAAVDYLSANGGGTLFVPKGNYCFRPSASDANKGVKWKTKVSLIGAGVSSTKFMAEGQIFDLFYALDYVSNGSAGSNLNAWLEDCRFENFQCNLEGLTFPSESVNGKAFFMLYLKRCRFNNLILKNSIGTSLGCDFLVDTVIENVIVENAGRNWGVAPIHGIGQSGIGIGTGADAEEAVVVTNCHIYNCGNFGIFVETQNLGAVLSNFAKITNNHVEGNNVGIGNKGSGKVLISGNSVFKNDTYGIEFSENNGKGSIVVNNHVEENGGAGISIAPQSLGDLLVDSNVVRGNGKHGIDVNNTGIQKNIKNVTVSNNKVFENGWTGIMVAGTKKYIRVKNNEVYNNGKLSTNAYTNKGIYIDVGVDLIDVIGNAVYDDQTTKTQTTDLYIASTVTNYYIENNNVGVASNNSQSGIVGDNKGLNGYVTGTATMPVGTTQMYVNHFLGNNAGAKVPTTILITPLGNELVWVTGTTEANRFQVTRASGTNELKFMWQVRF